MIYPNNLEKKLGFDFIKEKLTSRCLCSLGVEFVNAMKFSNSLEEIERWTSETEEFLYIVKQYDSFPQNNYLNISKEIDKLKIDGYFLSEEELYHVMLYSRTIVRIVQFFEATDQDDFKHLKEILTDFHFDKRIANKIEYIVDGKGILKSSASPALAEIRKQLVQAGTRLRSKVNRLLDGFKQQGFIGDDFLPTIRNGRMVLPVKSEYKRKVPGLIHDESSTGQTTYLEPAGIFDDNNELIELHLQEEREIRRILREITHELAEHLPNFIQSLRILGKFDFLRSKAYLAKELKAVKPFISGEPGLDVYTAYHPLLSYKLGQKNVVPLDLKLDRESHILIISGPNAGGKSVCLKTVGLLVYMLQSGLLVPVAENSKMGIFQNLFVDIGDDQSLENDLSTYSSHLKNMKEFIFYATPKSLFLIDEFGTGTDPDYGGALAGAILDELNHTKAFGVITTHYTILKEMGSATPGLINGSMLFNDVELNPLYILSVGKPGNSYAIEIAEKIGLDAKIIKKAKSSLGKEKISYDEALKVLNREKTILETQNREIKKREAELKQNIKDYKDLKEHLDVSKKTVLLEAKKEAKEIIIAANKTIENTIAEIKKSNADKEKLSVKRQELSAIAEKNEIEIKTLTKQTEANTGTYKLKEGDIVCIKGQTNTGKIFKINQEKAEVIFGGLKLTTKLSQLVPAAQKHNEIGDFDNRSNVAQNIVQKKASMTMTLDIRGMRVQEALLELEKYFDNVLVTGISEFQVIHGKGNGILKDLTRNYLKEYKQVSALRDEHPDHGGSGVTVVTMI